ncbi:uncharacterized protein FOMMEDRAFT_149765 [Fomitiporia mediterranea MF3/22]|uniref:uncharacterized protein n=1 Tax=Fomitiporia mediterranea (strain MF3/22) TaxID=694068 RepID=UPI000440751C|nr:uncharacterized protein FOMMEDRAFT_149765 [Fomitiporia mediterranea MF3/22]EJD07254.1 hypothetical protein FOMMEDRAFT_149765 [Fomitiporia mediterranea MF3/22]
MSRGDVGNSRIVITIYHLFVTFIIVVFGAWKAAAVSQDKAILSDTLDWIVGIIIGVLLFALSEIKNYQIPALDWLFRRNIRDFLWYFFDESVREDGDNIDLIERRSGNPPRLPTLSFDGRDTVLDVPRDYSEGEELVDSPQEELDGLLIFNDPDESGSELRRR